MKYPEVPIGELASSEHGAFKIGPFGSSLKKEELVPSGIPVVGIENVLTQRFTKPFRRFISEKKFKELSDYTIQPDDILVTTMGTVGKTTVVPKNIELMIFDSHLFRMRVDQKKVIPQFLSFAINNYEGLLTQLEQKARGAIMDGLNTTILKECVIPLPPLHEQQRIAAILQKADRLRRLRRYARQLSDGYLQSVFLEMFGDPKKNQKGYSLVKLGDLMSFMTSGSRGWAEHYCDKGALFLRVQNVGANSLLLDDVAYVQPPDSAESRRTRVKSGDLLISATADIGRTGVIPDNFPEAYINQHLFLIRLKYFNPFFVAGYFSTPSGKAQILQLDREGVKSGLNFDDAKGLTVFNAPLEEQELFAVVYQRYEHLCNQQSESMRQAEHLFQSLLQQAFQGEL
jgi:type I restriction enzyme S subunit